MLLRLENAKARTWYEKEALEQGWSVRTLDRNVSTLYYERLLMSPEQEPVVNEMEEKTEKYELNRLEFVKNPVIAEFLGVPQDKSFVESDLEQAILANLQQFLMEMAQKSQPAPSEAGDRSTGIRQMLHKLSRRWHR